jgi:hypothetical protein
MVGSTAFSRLLQLVLLTTPTLHSVWSVAEECTFVLVGDSTVEGADAETAGPAETWLHCQDGNGAVPVFEDVNVTKDSVSDCFRRCAKTNLCTAFEAAPQSQPGGHYCRLWKICTFDNAQIAAVTSPLLVNTFRLKGDCLNEHFAAVFLEQSGHHLLPSGPSTKSHSSRGKRKGNKKQRTTGKTQLFDPEKTSEMMQPNIDKLVDVYLHSAAGKRVSSKSLSTAIKELRQVCADLGKKRTIKRCQDFYANRAAEVLAEELIKTSTVHVSQLLCDILLPCLWILFCHRKLTPLAACLWPVCSQTS